MVAHKFPTSEAMLANGYFPKELPACFSTTNFASFASSLKHFDERQWRSPSIINLAGPGTLRRRLSLVNPFSQLALTNLVEQTWPELEKHFSHSRISVSKPVIGGPRALSTAVPMRDLSHEKINRMRRARYTVRADISHFYGSIYTHTIEWALHSKAVSKARLGKAGRKLPVLTGGRIDKAVQAGQGGQTKGIPVGPDTSLVIAEIIACAIDRELQSKSRISQRFGLRFMGDLEYFCRTRSEAEDTLYLWESELGQYDLTLNASKTAILDGPVPSDKVWPSKLTQFVFRGGSDMMMSTDLRGFFALAFELASENRLDAVLTYALRRVAGLKPFSVSSWKVVQSLVLAAVVAEPSCISVVAEILTSGKADGSRISMGAVSEAMNDMCMFHAPLEQGSEVAWSLKIIRDLGLKLSSAAARKISKMKDNCCLILLQDLVHNGLISGAGPNMTEAVDRAESGDACTSEDWLLGYEYARNRWAGPSGFRSDPNWMKLLKNDVAFYSPIGAPVTPSVNTIHNSRLAISFGY